MGDIIKRYEAKSTETEAGRRLRFLYDSGSPRTFIKKSAALKMKDVFELRNPRIFHGMGDGKFSATHAMMLLVKLKGIWVDYLCYVVPDKVFEEEYDVLVGHDFMRIYDISLNLRKRDVIISKGALISGMKIKKAA
ncbi:MAG: retropepsin-like aspartic protease [bacterium]